MEAAKKAQLEKQIVAGLLVVFGATLLAGPLRSLLPKPARRAAPVSPAGTVKVSKSIGSMMQETWDKVDPDKQRLPRGGEIVKAPALYTAQDARDPLISLIPKEPPPAAVPGTAAAAKPDAPKPVPKLIVTGLVWGGPHPKAVINQKTYGVGDSVEGVTIVDIGRRGVTVEYLGSRYSYAPMSAWPSAVGKPAGGSAQQARQ